MIRKVFGGPFSGKVMKRLENCNRAMHLRWLPQANLPEILCNPALPGRDITSTMWKMLREKRRIAFFGGTFDPIHRGHIEMAQAAVDRLDLNQVYFVPAGRNPLKKDVPMASDQDRVEMIRLGIAGYPKFNLWDAELSREGPSYTLDSVRHVEQVFPNAHLFWLIGADQLPFLHQWYGINELVLKIGFILVSRAGYAEELPRIPGIRLYPVENPPVPVSATGIRSRVRKGLSLKGLTPDPVVDYVCKNRLYL